MTIHIVASGQTLFGIAATYGVDASLIAGWNGLRPPFRLAVGQSLLILTPQAVYTVQPGDTLSAIASRAGTTPLQLLRLNPALSGLDLIRPGQVLVLSLAETPQRAAEINGYAYPFVRPEILRGILPYTTYLTPFTYGISASEGLVPLNDGQLLALAGQYGVAPLMHLSTLTENDTFSTERAAALLASPARQDRIVAEVADVVQAKGYRGLDLDFEFLGRANAAPYAGFAAKLREAMNALGYPLITALAPKTSTDQPGLLYEGHDYAALAAASDAVLLMTYEWGYTYGPPLAVAPLPNVRQVVEYALTEIPAGKLCLGIPNYGYDWALPYQRGTTAAVTLGNIEALDIARRYGAQIMFDDQAQAPFFWYTDNGVEHIVWFEDARSIQAKLRLVPEYSLLGAGWWSLMRPFRANWLLLDSMFRLR